jgi:hypothetical protein
MDAEGELDDPGDSICFAQAPLILERLGIAARLLHATKEVRFADDAEVGRRHWPGVRLERSQKLRDVVGVGLRESKEILRLAKQRKPVSCKALPPHFFGCRAVTHGQ